LKNLKPHGRIKEREMDNRPISRSEIPKLESLPDDIRSKIESVQEKTGFVPNVFLIMARKPDEFRGFCTYYDAIMETECGLTKAELEMIVVATSAQNNCLYCVVSHGAVLRIRAKDPVLSDQLAINFRKSKITKKQMAMLNFAVKVTKESDNISDKDFEILQDHGFDIEDAWRIASVASFFAMSNRLANTFSMLPNTEFYNMGR
jgi:uncharacterized peroxidase-related enzyme